jgi:hypothetical protein
MSSNYYILILKSIYETIMALAFNLLIYILITICHFNYSQASSQINPFAVGYNPAASNNTAPTPQAYPANSTNNSVYGTNPTNAFGSNSPAYSYKPSKVAITSSATGSVQVLTNQQATAQGFGAGNNLAPGITAVMQAQQFATPKPVSAPPVPPTTGSNVTTQQQVNVMPGQTAAVGGNVQVSSPTVNSTTATTGSKINTNSTQPAPANKVSDNKKVGNKNIASNQQNKAIRKNKISNLNNMEGAQYYAQSAEINEKIYKHNQEILEQEMQKRRALSKKLLKQNYNFYNLPSSYPNIIDYNNFHLPEEPYLSYYVESLFNALYAGDINQARYFLDNKKIPTSVRAPNGDTTLMCSVRAGQINSARLVLIKSPKVINEANQRGQTALHIAIIEGNYSLVKLLLTMGADINVSDIDHKLPINYATLYGDPEIIRILEDYS